MFHGSGGAKHNLHNRSSRVGADASYSQKAQAAYDQGKTAYEGAKGAVSAAQQAYTAVTTATPEEKYVGGNWNPKSVLAGDSSFTALRDMLNAAAEQSAATRKAREKAVYSVVASGGGAAALLAMSPALVAAGPAIAVIAACYVAYYETWKALQGDRDSQENRDQVVSEVRALWDNWRMVPGRHYLPDFEFADTYRDYVARCNQNMNRTEPGMSDIADPGPPWRAQWVAVMDNAIRADAPPALRDLAVLGWIPRAAPPAESFRMMVEDGKWMDFPDLWFGQTVTHTYKPGFLEAGSAHEWSVSAPTFEAMQADSDRGAAATAILVGTYMKVPLEPVIEAAVAVNRKVLLDVGPQPYNQAWRIKAVFLAAMDVANQLKARFAKNVANAFASILAKEQLDKNIAKVLANLTYVPPKVVVPASVVPPASSIRLEDRGATLLSRIRRLYPPTRKWL